jgi:hypothetical protein
VCSSDLEEIPNIPDPETPLEEDVPQEPESEMPQGFESQEQEEYNGLIPDSDPQKKDIIDEIYEIKSLMIYMEEKMRDDRFDKYVEMAGNEINQKLQKLIEETEEESNNKKKMQPQEQSQKQRKEQLSMLNGKMPATKSRLKEGASETKEKMYVPPILKDDSSWAKLPTIRRESILQIPNEDIPIRWRKRITAYMLSVNAAESDFEVDDFERDQRIKEEKEKEQKLDDDLKEFEKYIK